MVEPPKNSPSFGAVVGSEIRDPEWIKSGSGINIPDPQQGFRITNLYPDPNSKEILTDPKNTGFYQNINTNEM
jgi:hypothetical protein